MNIGFVLLGVMFFLWLFWRFMKALAVAEAERQAKQKADADASRREKVVSEAVAAIAKLKKPLDGDLNEKQVTILYALCSAGKEGLLMEDLAKKIWGWDGSNVGMTRFLADWFVIWHERHLFTNKGFGYRSTSMIFGPIDEPEFGRKIQTPEGMNMRFRLEAPGHVYLLEHKII